MIIKKRRLKKVLYTIIIAFAIICFWRGVWGLLDIYLFPYHTTWSLLFSIFIGVIILYLAENEVEKLI